MEFCIYDVWNTKIKRSNDRVTDACLFSDVGIFCWIHCILHYCIALCIKKKPQYLKKTFVVQNSYHERASNSMQSKIIQEALMIRRISLLSLVVIMMMSIAAIGQDKNRYIFQMPDMDTNILASDRWIGVIGRDVDPVDLQSFKLKELSGVIITQIKNNSPASKVDLKVNDVILEYDHQRLVSMRALRRMVDETPLDRNISLLISRDGSTREVKVTVEKRLWEFEMPQWRNMMPSWLNDEGVETEKDCPYLGLQLQVLTPELRKYFGVNESAGVLIAKIEKDSVAEKSGFQVGDVIVRINQDQIKESSEVRQYICESKSLDTVTFTIVRNRKEIMIHIAKGAGILEKT
jgi:membrane-associated protease RseP (regulator of RpoE activity)